MFLRRINSKKSGKSHYYWALVESYRTERGSRQRIVGYIGDVGKGRAAGLRQAVEPCESYQQDFFSPEELPEKVEILPKKTRTERKREFGGVWLGSKLFDILGLDRVLSDLLPRGEEVVNWPTVVKVLVLSRFCSPSSELHIAQHLYENMAFEDFLGVPVSLMYENRLYRCLDRLLPHKDAIQHHLKDRLGTLFDLKYDLFLYDVTSTYFEGTHEGSNLAQRGYSRDSRPDCTQVCIALVVTREGLPLGYEVFAGNRNDSTTVQEVVTKMESLYGQADRIWVMDRGMTNEENLAFLREGNRRYIIGTPRNTLRRFELHLVDKGWQEVRGGVEVKLCPSPYDTPEVFIMCRSKERALKEEAMHNKFLKRIEQGLEKLQRTCDHSTRDITRIIERRIGRLLQSNSRGASLFEISTHYDQHAKKTVLKVRKNDSPDVWARLCEGHYLLRSNIQDWQPEELWTAYIHLTDAEAAFRIHKSDLSIRPIWHQRDDRIQAHILVCFLAFVLWKTFGQMCKKAGLGDEPRRVFEQLATIAMVDVVLTTTANQKLKIRTVARPDKPILTLLHRLGLQVPQTLTKRVL
jgi:transposase